MTGRLQMRQWTDRDNNKRTSAEVVADHVYFGESKRKEEAPAQATRFQEIDDTEGSLPF